MDEREPNIISSAKSQSVLVDNYRFEINIFKLDGESTWTLEVIDHNGTSHVWGETFPSDGEALKAAVKTLNEEGAAGFLVEDDIIPFPSK